MRLGIDFGTSFSLAATNNLGSSTVLLPSGVYGIDSVFYYDDWEDMVIIGQEAIDAGQGDQVQNLSREIKMDLNSTFTTTEGKSFTAKEIVGYILAKVVDVAMDTAKTKLIDEELEGVVLSVPAAFQHNEKEFIRQAAAITRENGGPELNVLGIIKEPVAAALSYFDDPLGDKTKVMVYDLGGGTCDIAVVEANEAVREKFTVIASEMIRVGGRDWDTKIAEYITNEISKDVSVISKTVEAKIRKTAHDTKHMFSSKIGNKYRETVRANVEINGKMYKVPIDKDTLNRLTGDLVDQTMNLAKNVLKKDDCRDVKQIICVGGGSNMPQIISALESNFPDKDIKVYNPEHAIALGAAKYAENIDINNIEEDDYVTDIAAFSYGIKAHRQNEGPMISNLILKGDKLPKTIRKSYSPKNDNQKTASIRIFESSVEKDWCDLNEVPEEHILKVELPLPENIKTSDTIEVIVTLTADGILEVSVDDRRGNIKKGRKVLNF